MIFVKNKIGNVISYIRNPFSHLGTLISQLGSKISYIPFGFSLMRNLFYQLFHFAYHIQKSFTLVDERVIG